VPEEGGSAFFLPVSRGAEPGAPGAYRRPAYAARGMIRQTAPAPSGSAERRTSSTPTLIAKLFEDGDRTSYGAKKENDPEGILRVQEF